MSVNLPRTAAYTDRSAIHDLLDTATRHDGVAPFDEAALLSLDADKGASYIVEKDASIVGVAHVLAADQTECEVALVVHPHHRRQKIGSVLLDSVRRDLPNSVTDLVGWAHGDLPAAQDFAKHLEANRVRELLVMLQEANEMPKVSVPPGFKIRTFEPGVDNEAWLALNAEAFAEIPDQGRWTSSDLHARLVSDWFDERGFFIAEDADGMAGFHWTKLPRSSATGEVYVIGLARRARSTGLAQALMDAGIKHLVARGANAIELYVDAKNKRAISLYAAIDFVEVERHVRYSVLL